MKKISMNLFKLVIFSVLTVIMMASSSIDTLAVAKDAPTVGTVSAIKFIDAETNYLAGLALDDQGYVWVWGYNKHGQLGAEDKNDEKKFGSYAGGMIRQPYFVEENIKVVDIIAGYHTSYALDDQGIVYAWGRGLEGQMGNGTTKTDNPRPIIVSNLSDKKIVKVATSVEAATRTYALDSDGKLYGWGYGSSNMIPGKTGGDYVSTPVELTSITDVTGPIKDIQIGSNHGIILNTSGDIFVWGSNANGVFGNGKITGDGAIQKVDWFATRNKKIAKISANNGVNLVTTEDNEIYQWGAIYKAVTSKNISTPEKVPVDFKSADYVPVAVTPVAGRYVNYFIDQFGRVWSWGLNVNYSFGTDGPLSHKLNTVKAEATLQPTTMGDGDTQGLTSPYKAPVFKNMPKDGAHMGYAIGSYKRHGQWSSIGDGLHPTIYDKKYMETVGEPVKNSHDYVFPIDKQGRRLVYTVREKSKGLYDGEFLVATDEYKGTWLKEFKLAEPLPTGLTEETSSPKVKESEKSWINLSVDTDNFDYTGNNLKELPYMSKIHTYQSSTLFIDNAGNLYKTGLDGSGAVAWGWDYSIYEANTAGNKVADGLYNMYTYEIMFMRGAPRMIDGSVKIESPKKKHYMSKKETDKVKLDLNLGTAYHDEQLNITVSPKLKEAKYIVMPYDNKDNRQGIDSPSLEDFNTAYQEAASKGYTTLDLAEKNGWKGLTSEVGKDPVVLSDDSIIVSDNAVVWVLLQTDVYSATSTTVKSMKYDNFYTETLLKQQGINIEHTEENTYVPLEKNVNKERHLDDKEDVLYGFPLDKQKQVIHKPTFGYDQVSVSRIPDSELKLADEDVNKIYPDARFDFFWKWSTPQRDKKVYTLNGVDKPNNSKTDLMASEGELDVPDPVDKKSGYIHSFYYGENPVSKYNLHFIAVDKDGTIFSKDEFEMATEELLRKGKLETRRALPSLKISDKLIPKKYKILETQPPSGTISKDNFKTLVDKKAEYRVPLDESITDVTIVFMYEKPVRDVSLNVRQVVINPTDNVEIPANGFVTLDTALDDWVSLKDTYNVMVQSGSEMKEVNYTRIGLKVDNEKYRYLTQFKIPQYYEYEGYKLSNTLIENDSQKMGQDQSIKIDYSDDNISEQWLTIYLKPTTSKPLNYSWEQILNVFGEIKHKIGSVVTTITYINRL
ncbi:MAG: RCC1 domain-containing protein [Vagococcus sp.]